MPAKRLTACAVLVVVALVAFCLLQGSGDGAPPTVPDGTAVTTATGAAELAGATDPTAAADQRSAVPAIADHGATGSGTATLRVTVVWADSQPAVAATIFLAHTDYLRSIEPIARGLTDAHGLVKFIDVPLGKLRLMSDRGDEATTEIAPGDNEYRFLLKAGVTLRGRVVDPAGSAVGGASIWLQTAGQSWWRGRAIATADANGAFELHHAPTSTWLGALAAGFGPSELIDLELVDVLQPSTEITLRLTTPGGSLVGRVSDSAGAPIPGALVVAGTSPTRLDYRNHRLIAQWTAPHATTDADGRFALIGCKTGKQPVSVRAAGFGIWRSEVTIAAAAPTTIEVTLQVAAAIHGRITRSDGKPVAGASIRAYDRAPETPFIAGGQIDFEEEFGHVGTRSDAEGIFRLDGITPGTAHVFAQEPRDRSVTTAKTMVWVEEALALAPGSDTEWNPVLDDGRTISGIVLYRDGFPFPGLFLTLTDEKSGKEQTFNTNRSADFRFCCLAATTYSLRVQVWLPAGGAGFITRNGLVPDQGRVEVRTDFDKPVEVRPGVVTGRIDDRGGRLRNPRAASITLHIGGSSWRDGCEIKDGAFRIEDVEPGRHRVSLVEGTTILTSSDWFEVVTAATTDAGVLVTEPGSAMRITVERGPNDAELEPTLVLRRDGDPQRSTEIRPGRANEYLAENLTPGDYAVTCFGPGIKGDNTRTTVKIGVVATATVKCSRCALARFDVWWPGGHEGSKTWRYRVTGSDGALLIERDGMYRGDLRPYPAVIAATPGTWHVEYSTDDGLHGAADFTIGPDYADVKGRIDLVRR